MSFQSLEQRLALDASEYFDISQLPFELTYTTFDAPANHVTPRGTPFGFDGVVRLDVQGTLGGIPFTGIGSGTLLPNGTHILTAAHNFTSAAPNPIPVVTNITATFELPGGNVVVPVILNQIDINPNWNRNAPLAGSDIAVFELANAAPIAAPRFDIYRGAAERFSVTDKVGYGRSGQGLVQLDGQGQPVLPAGTKRDGDNRYEFFAPNTTVPQSILLYDFDDGTAAHDAFGFAGQPNLGLGNAEVLTAPGDSGGPSLLNGLIAGVTSFHSQPLQGDIDGLVNSSFGELGGDTRVSVFAGWIDSVVDIVAPAAPTTPNLLAVDDTGNSDSDDVTRLTTLRFFGSAEAGSTVELLEGTTVLGTAIANAAGNWTIIASGLTPNIHSVAARARDVAGNLGPNSNSLTVTIDTVAPTPTLGTVSPDPRSTTVSSIGITFNEDAYGFVQGDLKLTRNSDQPGAANLLTGTQTLSNSTPRNFSINNLTTLTGTPGKYRLMLPAGSVTDLAGNSIPERIEMWTRVNTAPPYWQNADNRFDVNANGAVTSLDALNIINRLNNFGSGTLPDPATFTGEFFYFNVNRDREIALGLPETITALDALTVIRHLDSGGGGGASSSDFDVRVRIAVTDLAGNAITTIKKGESFLVKSYISDVRTTPRGVFSAYHDLAFDSSHATVQGGVNFGAPDYAMTDGGTVGSGLLDEVGAIFSMEESAAERLLYSVQFTADQIGQIVFGSNAAEDFESETTVFDITDVVANNRIDFGSATLVVYDEQTVGNVTTYDYDGPSSPVNIVLGGTTIQGVAEGRVRVVRNTSGAAPTVTKSESGTLNINQVSAYATAVLFYNDAGTTRFNVNTGQPGAAGTPPTPAVNNWTTHVRNGSLVQYATPQNLAELHVTGGSGVVMTDHGSNALVVNLLEVQTASGSYIDVRNNDLVVQNGAQKDYVRTLFQSGHNGIDASLISLWNGPGIRSSWVREQNVIKGWDLYSLGGIKNGDLAEVIAPGAMYTTFTGSGGGRQ